jgi:DNA polymerase-1
MGNNLLDILNNIDSKPSNPNDRPLIIDGLNIYMRAFSASGSINDKGVPVGGMVGFLKSLSLLIRNTNPTRVIITFDGKGGSKRRKKLLPEYKDNRTSHKKITKWDQFATVEDEQYSMAMQLSRLYEYLEKLPVTIIIVDNIEADDVISYLTKSIFTENEIYIASGDQDFLQLVDDRVSIWSATKKKMYTPQMVLEDYGIPHYNFLIYKALIGDKSDNVKGIKGLGPKKIPKLFPEIKTKPLSIDDIIEYSSQQLEKLGSSKGKMYQSIISHQENLELGYKIMNLIDTNISGNSKMEILKQLDSNIYSLSKNSFLKLYAEDFLGENLGNPEQWLDTSFLKLNTLIKKL